MMKYSILMSVYAKERPEYLERAIKSMLSQTIPSDDFVLVCDGPLTKDLEKVIAKYRDQLMLLRLPVNQGLGNALRRGIGICRHELIARMDSDDISLPDRCEKQIQRMKADPDLSILGTFVTEFQEDPAYITGQRTVPETDEEIRKSSRLRNPFNHPSVMIRKSAVLRAGSYREKFPLFEDYDLWIRMLKNGERSANFPESLVSMQTSPDLYLRRGGWSYAKKMLRFRRWMYLCGWSSCRDFWNSALGHFAVCILPNPVRKRVYRLLHK